ncbi:hypothetical protein [Brevundimonas sp.]
MDTLLIVLALAAVAVAVVVWIARRKTPNRPPHQQMDQDTAWNDPVAPEDSPSDKDRQP